MSATTRRSFLKFIGAAGSLAAVSPRLYAQEIGPIAIPSFTPVRIPVPLPAYTLFDSFLATDVGGVGTVLPATADPKLTSYTVIDDVVLPPEFRSYTILKWGDRVYADANQYCGFNHDWTGISQVSPAGDSGIFWVNHEYTSDPWGQNINKVLEANGFGADYVEVDGAVDLIQTFGEVLYNVGGSQVRLQKNSANEFEVVSGDASNVRWHGLSGIGVANPTGGRPDGLTVPTSWGPRPHQQGDSEYLVATGPAAVEVFPNSVDGLGDKIVGTNSNCSGGLTPWGSFITCEENFQFTAAEDVGPGGNQVAYNTGSIGETFGLVGEKYGWCVEFDPTQTQGQGYRPKKHTSLGRFRHENIAFQATAGQPLVAYMGDDRRGGHTYKWISDGIVDDPTDPANTALLESGRLFAARYEADGTGRWIQLDLTTPIDPNVPSEIASEELAQLGTAQRDGLVRLPQRNGVGAGTQDGGSLSVDLNNEATEIPAYLAAGSTLADFYESQGAILCDAFLACNLVGATPTGRPEDVEVNPRRSREVIIAYTDGIAGGDGYTDSRIFTVNKYTTDVDGEQPSGGFYKIREDASNATSLTFQWTTLSKSGEAGAANGRGFANVDNLAFDDRGNVWGVTDMSTSRQNTILTGSDPDTRTVDHSEAGDFDEEVGVFGNNWMFYVAAAGQRAGEVIPFAYGPVKCEMTGPTFVGDTLLLAVQHPGESMPSDEDIDLDPKGPIYPDIDIPILDLEGELFTQTRSVPLSSEWPREIQGNERMLPQPAVIGITRRAATGGGSDSAFLPEFDGVERVRDEDA